MDELIKEVQRFRGLTDVVTVEEALIAFGLALFLVMLISKVYQWTHDGVAYNRSFVITMVMMSVIVAGIMIVIGSNIARAFSLVGALSIVRYRTAVKDPRDVAFIFFSMAVGMACGTRFYMIGIVLTLFMCASVLTLKRVNFGSKIRDEWLLRIQFAEDADAQDKLDPLFNKYILTSRLVRVDAVRMGTLVELTYSVVFRSTANTNQFVREATEANENHRVQLLSSQEHVDA